MRRIDGYAKDGGNFLPRCLAFFNRIPIQLFNNNSESKIFEETSVTFALDASPNIMLAISDEDILISLWYLFVKSECTEEISFALA